MIASTSPKYSFLRCKSGGAPLYGSTCCATAAELDFRHDCFFVSIGVANRRPPRRSSTPLSVKWSCQTYRPGARLPAAFLHLSLTFCAGHTSPSHPSDLPYIHLLSDIVESAIYTVFQRAVRSVLLEHSDSIGSSFHVSHLRQSLSCRVPYSVSAMSSRIYSPSPDIEGDFQSGTSISTPVIAMSAHALQSFDVALKRTGKAIEDSDMGKTSDTPAHPYHACEPFKDDHQYTIGMANFNIDYLTNKITSFDNRGPHMYGTDLSEISGSTLIPVDESVSCGLIRIIPKASEKFPWWKVDGWTGRPASDKTYEQKTHLGLLRTGFDGEIKKVTVVCQDDKRFSDGPGDIRYLCQTLDIASTEESLCEAHEVIYNKGAWVPTLTSGNKPGHLPFYCVKDTLSGFSDLTNQIIKDENMFPDHEEGVIRHTMLSVTNHLGESALTLILTESPAVKAFKIAELEGCSSESMAIVSGATVLVLLSG